MQTLTTAVETSFFNATTHPLEQDAENQSFWLHPFAQCAGGKKQFYQLAALYALFPPLLGVFLFKKLYAKIYFDVKSRSLLRKSLFGDFEVLTDLRNVKRVDLLFKENKYFGEHYEVAVIFEENGERVSLPLLVFQNLEPAREMANLLLGWAQGTK
jgi:hypothetical protein